jgi:replicative DNA helicase
VRDRAVERDLLRRADAVAQMAVKQGVQVAEKVDFAQASFAAVAEQRELRPHR